VRFCRISLDDELHFGAIDGLGPDLSITDETIVGLIDGHPFGEWRPQGRIVPLSETRLVAPVLPSKVIGIGRNYADHVREMGGDALPVSPVIFLKPSTAVIGPGEPIALPWQSELVHHEGELAVVIGRICRDVPVEKVDQVIFGYTCANDVTARDLQKIDGQWVRAKGFDTFCPIGPWIETELTTEDLRLRTMVNDDLRQDGSTADLIFDVAALVSFVSSVMTLIPGDVILTGTPAGVGPIIAGDTVRVSIAGIGTLENPVVDRE
jgi:2-keto-4-pentenoate hydratase/2-oxohepta-3-ene-1,7-dioic acid hydratase in catechol pathway